MKVSAYNHVATSFVAGRYLAFNALSGTLLRLDDAELADYDALLASIGADGRPPPVLSDVQRAMIDAGFAIDDACDEPAELRRRYDQRDTQPRGLGLTIAPTLTCNLACSYCFQTHSSRRMSADDADDVYKFAQARLVPDSSLDVTWFGGEPLAALDVIEALAPRLQALARDRNCAFKHSMITNGVLLTAERAAFLASVEQFEHAQITLDGPRDTHDRRRPTLSGHGTYDRIVANLVEAVRHISVVVRINVDRSNAGQLEPLLDALLEALPRDRINLYLGHVWNYTAEVGCTDLLSHREFAAVDAQFKFVKLRKGLGSGAVLPRPRRGSICSADSADSFVLGPGGAAFECWNEVHGDPQSACGWYGAHTAPRPAAAPRFKTRTALSAAACASCGVAPLCLGGCPWEAAKPVGATPGHCIPARYNLADELRLYDLEQTLARAGPDANG
ncbi:radical SAM/SPASM domain-containing protein [Rhodopseudomonas sp. B29]|uniref:radical SAM/SPASM domain-containing protein n=1 Tax=Rhodopseudomonas sp. B29 TaxID=95607 RepID=UPI0003496B21|nr:radical SAM/SPASM domain-containing protein [Rhodopseudomonas sp. B29]